MRNDREKVQKLVHKGLNAARKAVWKMHDEDGNLVLPVAFEIHEPAENELFEMGDRLDMGEDCKSMSTASSTPKTEPLKTSFGLVQIKG